MNTWFAFGSLGITLPCERGPVFTTGLMYFHTVSADEVTSKKVPLGPLLMSVLPFGRRPAPEMKLALKSDGLGAVYVHVGAVGSNASPAVSA